MNQVNNGLTPIYPYNTFPHNSTLPGEERSEMDLIYDSKGKRRSQGAEVSPIEDTREANPAQRKSISSKATKDILEKSPQEGLVDTSEDIQEAYERIHHPKPQAPYSQLSAEEMSHILSQLQLKMNSAELVRKNERLSDLNNERRAEHEKRIISLQKALEQARKSKQWGGLQTAVNTLIQGAGLFGAAGSLTGMSSALATNPAGWAVLGIMVVNALSTADEVFNDGATSDKIFGEHEQIKMVAKTLLGLGAAFSPGALGAQVDLSKTWTYAQTAISSSLVAAKAQSDYTQNTNQREMLAQEDKVVELTKRLKDLLEENKEMANSLNKLFKNMADVNKEQDKVRETAISAGR